MNLIEAICDLIESAIDLCGSLFKKKKKGR
ncbi:hypothetical protein [Bacillus phage YungSlug]|nr:hypothetical protein [Bacillus phage YungSlug]